MFNRTVIIGVSLIILSALFFAGTWSFPDDGGYVSARVFPRIISGCMFILAAIMVGQSLFKQHGLKEKKPTETQNLGNNIFPARWRIITAAIAAFAYTQVIESLGYLISTALLLAVMVLLFQEKRWYVVATVSILGTVGFYSVFRLIFKVPLPRFYLF